ncbi:MAG: ubiquinone/menaquinone biosynthesis methyltransferase [Planctomycetota bacterium]
MNVAEQRRPGSGEMFDGISARYDLLNRLTSLGLDQGWRRALVGALAELAPTRVLDVAAGTADVSLELARRYPAARVTGLDPSEKMLARGAEKVRAAGLAERVQLVRGDALALGFPDGAFDAATVAFGVRNFPDRARGLAEMARVVRPGGLVAVLELGEPRGLLGPLARLHVHTVVPLLGRLLSSGSEYRYLSSSIAGFPAPEAFQRELAAAGLYDTGARPLGFGAVHLYLGRVPEDRP